MLEHNCSLFSALFVQLSKEIAGLESTTIQVPLIAEDKLGFANLISQIKDEAYKLKLLEIGADSEMHRISSLHAKLTEGDKFTPELLAAELKHIQSDFVFLLMKMKFAYIPAPNDKYFEQEQLFGEKTHEQFRDACNDIKDAGNCIAAELYTAAVFHLMRVAEFGLRHIADRVKVELKDKGNPIPIEYATWDKVIQGIQNKITETRKLSQGVEKNEELQFYSDAADQATFIKDLWRNDVSHTRKRYNDREAIGVFVRVKGFMKLLAKGKA